MGPGPLDLEVERVAAAVGVTDLVVGEDQQLMGYRLGVWRDHGTELTLCDSAALLDRIHVLRDLRLDGHPASLVRWPGSHRSVLFPCGDKHWTVRVIQGRVWQPPLDFIEGLSKELATELIHEAGCARS